MIKIEKTEVYGWEASIRGARNPWDSWSRSDSKWEVMNKDDVELGHAPDYEYTIGKNDLDLMRKLAKAGTDHSKFMRMINVTADITAPLYWWKEFKTYRNGRRFVDSGEDWNDIPQLIAIDILENDIEINSCSTMHKIHAIEFTLDDFSHEHLIDEPYPDGEYVETYLGSIESTIKALNAARTRYIETDDKKYWWQMIQLLPSSYNQKRTVQLNYQVLRNMYHARKNHKLDEWHQFCDWIETLPYSELITIEKDK